MEYNIDIMSGIYDNGFRMVNSLTDFLNKTNHDVFDKSLPFVIKLGPHTDRDGRGIHFTFIHKGISYHAYFDEIITRINSVPIASKFRITNISAVIRYFA